MRSYVLCKRLVNRLRVRGKRTFCSGPQWRSRPAESACETPSPACPGPPCHPPRTRDIHLFPPAALSGIAVLEVPCHFITIMPADYLNPLLFHTPFTAFICSCFRTFIKSDNLEIQTYGFGWPDKWAGQTTSFAVVPCYKMYAGSMWQYSYTLPKGLVCFPHTIFHLPKMQAARIEPFLTASSL